MRPDRRRAAARPADDRSPTCSHALDPAIQASFTTAGPGYLAYIPGGGIPTAAIADLIACVTNRFVNVDIAAPGLAEIERTTLRLAGASSWACPKGSNGIFTSGGSLSNLAALVAAREQLLGEDFQGGTLYYSEDTHACVAKAAKIVGLPEGARSASCPSTRGGACGPTRSRR